MRLNKLFLLAFFALPAVGFGQNNWELGIKAGGSAGLSAIGGINAAGSPWLINIQPSQIRWDLGAYGRYRISKAFSLSAQFDYARVQGFDSLSKVTAIKDRNLNYRDDIIQGSLRLEWTFFSDPDVGGNFNYTTSFNAYLFAGVAIFHMNPKIMYTNSKSWTDPQTGQTYSYGDYVALEPLAAPGETYSLLQPAIPLGVGFYYTFNRNIRLGWEFCWDKTFTQYVGGVGGDYPPIQANDLAQHFNDQSYYVPGITKQELANYIPGVNNPRRGSSNYNDTFVTSAVTLGFIIHGKIYKHIKRSFFENNYKSRASF